MARQIALDVLAGVSAENFLRETLKNSPLQGDRFYGLCIGKAAGAMAKAMEEHLGGRLVSGFLVTHSHEAAEGVSPQWQAEVGGHPRPDMSSLKAGDRLIEWIESLPDNSQVIACLSGGASAVLEKPKPGFTLTDLQSLVDQSFSEGWTIDRLNQERARRSALKGGGLARLLGPKLKAVYCLSDVEPGRLEALGSGPFWTQETSGLHHLAADRSSVNPLVESACLRTGLQPVFCGSLSRDIHDWIDGDLQPVIGDAKPGTASYWTGELTIQLGSDPLPGGRCHEAAAWASALMQSGQACAAFGTDGMDGATDSAGAVTAPPPALPWCPEEVLERHSTLEWCRAVGASLPKVFTGSNLNDVVLLITQ